MKKPVMVIGGGIAGIQATHDLAEMGIPVFLIESSPTIGGRMAQLDKTFPTNDCSTCILSPKMTACYNHPLVKTLTFSEVIEVKGTAPDLVAVVKIKPKYVNEDLCKGCNDCFAVCPIKVKSEFDMGLGTRKAIYKPFAQAIPNKAIIDMDTCIKCKRCIKACNANAIELDQQELITEIPISAIIISTGYNATDKIPKELNYNQYQDVITSLEYERLMSASGPIDGHIIRPSDGETPKRIAFIQCVGSRDHKCDSDYCSSICCMQAVKGAIITKEHMPADVDIFFMDMRAFGKAFDAYADSAKDRYNIGFIRSRVSGIERNDDGRLQLQYTNDEGLSASAPYDLVVLSVGVKPDLSQLPWLTNAGVKADKYGFIWTNEFDAAITTQNGIYACGMASGPKDIPETVIEASAAAAAAAHLADSRETNLYQEYSAHFKQAEPPKLRDVSKEPIKIGVFVCHCGVNIAGFADVNEIVDYAKSLPFVVHVEPSLYACAIDAQDLISSKIAEHGINRIVVAACTPRTHEALFQDVLAKAGLNPYLFAMANIRDQCTWVHMDDKQGATFKAKELIRMAVGKVSFAKQLTRKHIGVTPSALVVGGGVSGMTSALELAGMGYGVYLVESSSKLGGNALRLSNSNLNRPVQPMLLKMIKAVENHPNITVYLNTNIELIDGYVGNFNTTVLQSGTKHVLDHGVVILAIGAGERKPTQYRYGKDSRIITQMELEQHNIEDVKRMVMIQCVGSRESVNVSVNTNDASVKDSNAIANGKPYCSRVCCNQAIKNALRIKEENNDIEITILYRDIRAYGMGELQYRDARKAGIRFIRYDEANKPLVEEKNGDLVVFVNDPVLNQEIALPADCLVLSSAMEPNLVNNTAIAQMLKVPLTADGFFLEAHVKLRPVDFATDGIYICGLAHAPKNIKECIIQGKAAAARAATVIAKDKLQTEGAIASIRQDYCAACGDCEQLCPYKAIEVSGEAPGKRYAKVNDVLCKGCGTCSAACRPGAIDVNGFSDRQILAEIEYLLRRAM